jgi:hypothetical protein
LVYMTIVFELSYCNVYGTGYQLRYVYRKQCFWDCGGIHNGHFEFVSNLRSSHLPAISNSLLVEDSKDYKFVMFGCVEQKI